MNSNFLLIILLSISLQLFSQENICKYADNSFVSIERLLNPIPNDQYILDIVTEIENSIGVKGNFVVVPHPGFQNCAATNFDGNRFIIYDPQFLSQISNNKRHIIVSIMAHEVAHHLLGHTLTVTHNLEEQRTRELEADYFSGVIMKKLGYTFNQAIEGVSKLSEITDDTNFTHPLKEKRNLVITEVFERVVKKVKYENGKIVEYIGNEGDPRDYISRVLRYSKTKSREEIFNKDFQRAQTLVKNGKYQEALDELNKLDTKPNDFCSVVGKIFQINVYRNLGNESKALEIALSLEQDSNNPDLLKIFDDHKFIANYVYFNISGSYDLLNNKPKALEYIKKCYTYLPEDKIVIFKMGVLNAEMGNYSDALNFLNQISAKHLIDEGFSPIILKRFFDAKIQSSKMALISDARLMVVKDLYFQVIYQYVTLWKENPDDFLGYITDYTVFLIEQFEEYKYQHSEPIIYSMFNNYYKPSKSIFSKKKSTTYLSTLGYFYKKYNFLFDNNSQIHNEIINLKQ